MTRVQDLLDAHGLRKTNIREEVLQLFVAKERALSKRHLEEALGEVDRITLYRTLKSFEQKGIIHKALDGTDTPKYALCPEHCTAQAHKHQHAHFHCKSCQDTFCVEEVEMPSLSAIQGHHVDQVELVVQGVCSNCRQA
jgi:Fur family ferric uptake transcriptional regulator